MSSFSPLQQERLALKPALPNVLTRPCKCTEGPVIKPESDAGKCRNMNHRTIRRTRIRLFFPFLRGVWRSF
jgi:hypothetical protein